MKRKMLTWTMFLGLTMAMTTAAEADYASEVAADSPVAWWRLNETSGVTAANSGSAAGFVGTVMLNTDLSLVGPVESAAGIGYDSVASHGNYVAVSDSGGSDPLDFASGDSITIEAFVDIEALVDPGRMGWDAPYILAKGRLGTSTDLEYSLRLKILDDDGDGPGLPKMCINFLGRNSTNSGWNQWSSASDGGFTLDSGWHHVALTYKFGDGSTMKGYVDGDLVTGAWSHGGSDAPYQNDEDIWLGSAQSGFEYATIHGGIDEVAVYRTALSDERILAHYEAAVPEPSTLLLLGIGSLTLLLWQKRSYCKYLT